MSESSDLFPLPHRPLDLLVRARMDAHARNVHPSRFAGLVRPRPSRWFLGVPAALAAALILILFAIQPSGQVQAGPSRLIASARQSHVAAVDRLYRLTIGHEGREVLLWTRGDRFRVEGRADGKGAWGRDDQGRIWVAPSRRVGLLFDPDEVPQQLEQFLALRSVNLPELLTVVLHDCELHLEPGLPGFQRIRAIPPVQSTLVDATLDLRDSEVQHLSLHRRILGKNFHLQFDLVQSGIQPDAFYRLTSCLLPGAEVLDRSRSAPRFGRLVRYLGKVVGKTI